ncbi:disease resistance protein RPP2B-like isoform X2 [Mangifera indica]|uniref:disease resistance protein RPP2B-like isoform X2 n=1 Tax=Mangifera indica TaxID=29780 RepID=UPI001CFA92E8|nr:disease resistance protein RPP2B-like isoform X2 [Mangifera indica]
MKASHQFRLMASSSNIPEVKYDVFLSFRGVDTRNNFTSHLAAALCRKKIRAFIDYEFDRGEEISPSLLKAIEQSKISVIILSENYASSRWCLEELAKILDCKQMFRQMVIPIFYHVDPSHVRNQTGAFGDAFVDLEKRFEESLDVLQRWKTALKEVANLSGWTADSKKCESELIEETIMDILKRLNKISLSDYSDLIGVEFAIKEIESLLKIGSNDVCIVGIWGLGGIGKTSISRAIFNKYLSYFEGSFFAENVREESDNHRRLTVLHQELLFKILEDRYANIGLTLTKERLVHKKVLIVFDDVTSLNQIENLIGDPKCFGLGSRIIITSRDKQVLNNCGADKIYKLEELVDYEALQLFNHFAFKHNRYTIKEYKELSKKIVTYAKGVPLTLKVLGSSLSGKTKQEWESAVNKLERSPPKDIQDVLKISFDRLDYEEKELFLDIACIFKGDNRNLVISVMDSCGCSIEIGLSVLIDKSLVIVSNHKITMHDLLEEMGKEIVRQESVENPGKRSRLFHHKDIYHVLTRNKGTKAIKGIRLDVSQVGEIHLTPHAFSKMSNLKYLKVYSSHCGEDFNKLYGFQDVESVFAELKYLFWPRYAWTTLPSKFHPENLVALEMPESNIEQLWPGVQNIVNLKCINLSYSEHLLECPDLSLAKNLVTLNLNGCTSLIEIHSSIQYLKKLSTLDLTNCTSLYSIPSGIYSKSLREVFFTGCSNLDTVPSLSCNVEKLSLDGTAIRELSSSIENLSKLVTLNLHGCTRLENLPNDIDKLKSLKHLILDGCSRLESLPSGIGELKSLGYLTLNDCSRLESLPSSISKLKSLGYLTLYSCSRLENLPSSIFCLNALEDIDLSGCSSLKIVSSFPCNIKSLSLRGSGIQELPSSIQYLSKLKTLDLTNCWSLESLSSSIGKLKSLIHLDLSGCLKLNSLPDEIGNLEALIHLDVGGTGIREIPPSIVCLNTLDWLSFEGCKGEEHVGLILPSLSGLQRLEYLNLSDCCIIELPSSLDQLTSLRELYIGRNKFESIPASIIKLSNLLFLDLCYCDVLKSLPELPSSIACIKAQNCKSLELLSGLSSTTWRLNTVNFINCLKLDQSALEDIAKPALQNIQCRKFELTLCQHFPKRYICFPGSSIPEWFAFRSKGSFIELPPGCLNDEVVDFSFCIVISLRDDHDPPEELRVDCEVQYEERAKTYWKFWPIRSSIDSGHIFLGCTDFLCSSTWFSINSEVLFQFYIKDMKGRRLECYEVKECGILFYTLAAFLEQQYDFHRINTIN